MYHLKARMLLQALYYNLVWIIQIRTILSFHWAQKNQSRLDDCHRNKCFKLLQGYTSLKKVEKHVPSLCEGIITANLACCPLLFSSPKLNPYYCQYCEMFAESVEVLSCGWDICWNNLVFPETVRFTFREKRFWFVFLYLIKEDLSLRTYNLLQV